MYSCSIRSLNATVDFFSGIDLFENFSTKDYARFIPGFSCNNFILNSPSKLIYGDDNNEILKYNRKIVEVNFPWNLMMNGESLLYLSYPLLEYQHEISGIITIHAAAFSYKDRAYLLLGKEGAGKSSVVIDICRRFGAKLISNDLCLFGGIDDVCVYEGTKFFFLRRESVIRNFPDLLKHFSSKSQLDSWQEKIFLNPEILCINIETRQLPLADVFLVHVDNSQESIYANNVDNLATRLFFNENFSRYIRATSTTMLGGSNYEMLGYIPSLDTKQLYNHRKRIIDYLFRDGGIKYVGGPLNQITDYIINNI